MLINTAKIIKRSITNIKKLLNMQVLFYITIIYFILGLILLLLLNANCRLINIINKQIISCFIISKNFYIFMTWYWLFPIVGSFILQWIMQLFQSM